MCTKKIKVEIKADKVKEVLEKLDKNIDTITMEIEVEESKEIYKYLSTTDDIVSWDFTDKLKDNSDSTKKTDEGHSEIEEQVESIEPNPTISITDYNLLATYVEAVWKMYYKSPTIIWGSNFFNKTLKQEYDTVSSMPVNLEHALLSMILQTYYRDVDIKDALEDTNNKLKTNCSKLKDHLSLASLSKALYE